MSELPKNQLHEALELLGNLLDDSAGDHTSLVVAGGSALVAQNLTSRRTDDVDVIAVGTGHDSAYPLPAPLKIAAAKVAKELNLEPNWLNGSMALFLGKGNLPEWIWWDLDKHLYGKNLTVSFIKREGLVLLKLYAALERDEARDLSDLRALQPTADEVERHLRFILREILERSTHPKLEAILNHIGHADLISRFQPAAQ